MKCNKLYLRKTVENVTLYFGCRFVTKPFWPFLYFSSSFYVLLLGNIVKRAKYDKVVYGTSCVDTSVDQSKHHS